MVYVETDRITRDEAFRLHVAIKAPVIDSVQSVANQIGWAAQMAVGQNEKRQFLFRNQMIDDILRGALSGLFAVPLARWAAKYKYRTVFFLCWAGANLFLFFSFLKIFGFFKAPIIFIERIASPIGIFLPLGIGLLGTTLVFIYTLGKPRKN